MQVHVQRHFVALMVIGCAIASPPHALAQSDQEYEARVVSVQAGDLITVERDRDRNRIREQLHLHGVDAPDKGQPRHKEARQFMERLVQRQRLQVRVRERDRDGRAHAEIRVRGQNANEALLRNGYGWAAETGPEHYRQLQREAQRTRLGLWKDNRPEAPWTYRERQRREKAGREEKRREEERQEREHHKGRPDPGQGGGQPGKRRR